MEPRLTPELGTDPRLRWSGVVRSFPMIGPSLASAYFLPSRMDETVFARVLLQRAGIDVTESDLTMEGARAVVRFAELLDAAMPGDWWDLSYRPGRTPDVSGSQLIDSALESLLTEISPMDAFKALSGLRPGFRHHRGALAKLRPVARAALGRELRRLGCALVDNFERQGRFRNTDRFIDEHGLRRARPA
jgi:hypothetical protein